MLNIDISDVNKKDMVYLHALMLTLKHFKYMNSYLSLICDNDSYYVYGFNSYYKFDSVDSACRYVLNLISFDSKVTGNALEYYNRMLSIQFNDSDALEYMEYYLDETNYVRERKK